MLFRSPWNDPGPVNPAVAWVAKKVTCGLGGRKLQQGIDDAKRAAAGEIDDPRPVLRAIIFDCSSVSNVDTTSVQSLADVRSAVGRYVGSHVEFHFVNITSPWIRRGLLAAGFGTGEANSHITEIAPVVSQHDRIHVIDEQKRLQERQEKAQREDIESGVLPTVESNNDPIKKVEFDSDDDIKDSSASSSINNERKNHNGGSGYDPTEGAGGNSVVSVPVIWNHDLTPFFHLDISTALAAATGKADW